VPENQLLEVMISAAIEAGRAISAIYRSEFEVHTKQDESPVTAADHAAEAIILARLAAAAGSIPVIAEEEVAAGRVPRTGREFFLVDPLDGTKEFIQRRGDFTVNIALVRDGMPELGVVFAPARSRLFAGDVHARHARLGPTMEWDTAAGHAVLAAAGGTVVNVDGSPFRYGKPEFRNPSFIATSTLAVLPQAPRAGVNA
jgi:3'-phosphoadenosine 5'-phosphosulfate (PAPS) 3'-phosphatase